MNQNAVLIALHSAALFGISAPAAKAFRSDRLDPANDRVIGNVDDNDDVSIAERDQHSHRGQRGICS